LNKEKHEPEFKDSGIFLT